MVNLESESLIEVDDASVRQQSQPTAHMTKKSKRNQKRHREAGGGESSKSSNNQTNELENLIKNFLVENSSSQKNKRVLPSNQKAIRKGLIEQLEKSSSSCLQSESSVSQQDQNKPH